MRKLTKDYFTILFTKIRYSKISHIKYLFGWVVYFVLFFLTEKFIPAEICHSVHCPLDDMVPFYEMFLIPYVLWYILILFTVAYFAVINAEGFKQLQIYFITTQLTAIACYILFPTRQDLRPIIFPRDNLLTDGVRLLYRIDTNTGVCPSMHAAFSLALVSAWSKEREIHWSWKAFVITAAISICLSTMFIKQHSMLDVLAAIPVCLGAEWIAYGRYYRSKYKIRKYTN